MHLSKIVTAGLLVACLLCAASTAQAQERDDRPELVDRVITIKYLTQNSDAISAIHALNSRWGRTIVDWDSRTIIIRDTAEAAEAIESLVNKIDVPPHRIRLVVHAFKASLEGSERPAGISEEVSEALAEVANVMTYKSFKLIESGLLNLSSDGRSGQLSLSEQFQLEFSYDYTREGKMLRLYNMSLYYRPVDGDGRRLFGTDVSIADGEVVVAGVSKLSGGGDAVLAVLTLSVSEVN